MQNLLIRKILFIIDFCKDLFNIKTIAVVLLVVFFNLESWSSEPSKMDNLLQRLSVAENDSLKGEILMEIALFRYYQNTDEAIRYANLALDAFNSGGKSRGLGRCNNLLGACYFSLGEYRRAEGYYSKSHAIASLLKDTLYLGKSLNNLGTVNQKLGKLDRAIEYYVKSLNYYSLSGNKEGELGVIINIATIYQTSGNYEKSIQFYNKAVVEASKLNKIHLLGATYHNLSGLYSEQEKYGQALEACKKAYSVRKETKNTNGQVKDLISFGNIYTGLNQPQKAYTYFSEALKLAQKSGNIEDEGSILLHLGYLELENENISNAFKYFSEGLIKADSSEVNELQLQFHKYLSVVDSIRGDYKSALRNYQAYQKLQSNLSEFNPDEEISNLKNKYDLAKQQNIIQGKQLRRTKYISLGLIAGLVIVILLFVITILILNLRNRKKIEELSQENLRSQINPHFIFNILNSIHTFILNNDKRASSQYLLKFAKLLRLTLDNSLTKLTTISEELEALKLYLDLESLRLGNRLEYDIWIDEEIDPYMFKIPPLLIQPYVENSIIHGIQNKKGKGKIEIQLRYRKNQIHCTISDDGVGRKKAMEINGFKNKKRISHGIKITETRLRLLNSFYGKKMGMSYTDLRDKDENPTGTKVEFNLPILS